MNLILISNAYGRKKNNATAVKLSASQAAEAPANAAYDYWLTLAAGGDGRGGTGITCFSNARLMMVLSYFCSDVFLRTK